MKVLYIYRHPNMGFSIGKVFKPIETEMKKHAEVESIYLPSDNYSIKGLWMNIKYAKAKIKERRYDIIHITGAEYYLIPFLKKNKTIVTIHDLGFYTNHKNTILAKCKYPLWIKSIKLARKVTFISEKSYQEAKLYLNFKTNQCCIIPNPAGKDYTFTPKAFNDKKPTILQIGTKSNKNVESTIRAIKDFPCYLRIIGSVSKGIKSLLELYNIEYSHVENITDQEIIEEYKNCDIVSFPSLYEGFGMPIIEGQSIGRVVVTSNLSPMKEVAGNSAILVNPYDIESMKQGYLKAIKEHDYYIKLGKINVKRFNLEEITKQYYQLYLKIC